MIEDRCSRSHPPGVVGYPTHYLGRYREFDEDLARLAVPPGTRLDVRKGINVARAFNDMVRLTLDNPEFKWLFILGDDHTFKPDILMQLLDCNVDAVVPFCLYRMSPYQPVLHWGKSGDFAPVTWSWFDHREGLVDITGMTAGNAGLLVRRHVLEGMADPWFEQGQINTECGGSDLYFCHKLAQAGFSFYLNLNVSIGHLTHGSVWPARTSTGWSCRFVMY